MSALATTTGPAAEPTVAEKKHYTYEELCRVMPETNLPHEIWDGELIMSPAPSFFHQEIVLRLYELLVGWVRPRKPGKVVVAPIDMVLSPSLCVQPDVAFIATERLSIIGHAIRGPVDLAMEVISAGERERARIAKRDLYEQYGVKEYWIVDPEAHTVEVLSLDGNQYRLVGRWRPGEIACSRLLPGFSASVSFLLTGDEAA
jgi:Uma2 family endonuclease